MNRMTKAIALLLGLVISLSSSLSIAEDQIRSELAKPLQAAQELIKGKKFRDALDKLHEADGITGKSAYENLVTEQLRLVASTSAGDGPVAAKAYEALVASGKLNPSDQQRYELAVANTFYQTKDYANAATWGKRYQTEGGTDSQVETLIVQSYYLSGDYGSVTKRLQEHLKSGERLSETQLQILGSSYLKLGDNANYASTLERLVAVYPKDEYWADLIHRVRTRPGFADRLSLDVGRLEQAVGQLKTTEQYVDQAELALQAGLPVEAKAVIELGFSKGVLGTGADAERHNRLKDLAQKNAAKDLADLPKEEADASSSKDGNALVAVGLNHLASGNADKAAQLIQKGIEKGGLKRLDDARLHLGIALARSGQKSKAVETFQAVQGADGTADLARLWLAQASKS